MAFILHFALVFFAMIFTDFVWGIYIKAVGQNRALRAGIFSGLIMVFGAFSVISYMNDHRYLIAAILGAFTGTYLSVLFHKKKEETSK